MRWQNPGANLKVGVYVWRSPRYRIRGLPRCACLHVRYDETLAARPSLFSSRGRRPAIGSTPRNRWSWGELRTFADSSWGVRHSPTRSQVDFCFTSLQSASALLVREVLWDLTRLQTGRSIFIYIVGFTFSEAASTLRDCRRVVALLLWLSFVSAIAGGSSHFYLAWSFEINTSGLIYIIYIYICERRIWYSQACNDSVG